MFASFRIRAPAVRRFKPTRLEVAALAVAAVIISFQLFVPPIIGVADDADFYRVTLPLGLDHASTSFGDKYFDFVDAYVQAPQVYSGWFTSELLMAFPAALVGKIVFRDGVFHVQLMGFIHAIIFLLALWMLLAQTRGLRPWLRAFTAALLVLVLTDVGYIA